jgi:fructokinase
MTMQSTSSLDVLALGELLVDMVAAETGDLVSARSFHKAAGGAPANVAVGVARLRGRAGFIGCVGADPFGRFLRQTLIDERVDTTGLMMTADAPTTLALVSRAKSGERDFQFYRNPGADTCLTAEAITDELLGRAQILHVGSLSLTHEPARSATYVALTRARALGLAISCDPNLRVPLWNGDLARARDEINALIRNADLLKISEDELEFLTGTPDPQTGAARLWHDHLRLMVVSLGPAGCWFRCAAGEGHVPGFVVDAIDTTGAGDSFVAGLLVALLDLIPDLRSFDLATLHTVLRRANATGALATTILGAIPALPSRDAMQALIDAPETAA